MINRLTEFLKYQGRSFCSWSQVDRNVRRFNKIIFLWWKYTQSSVYRDGTESDTDFTQVWIMWSLELVKAKPLLNRAKILWPYIIFYPKLPKKRKKRKNTCNWLNWSRVRAKRELRKYHVIIIFPPFSIRRVCVSTWRGKHVRETMWVFILIFLNYFWCFNGCIFILRALRYQVVDKRTEKIFKFTHNNSDETSKLRRQLRKINFWQQYSVNCPLCLAGLKCNTVQSRLYARLTDFAFHVKF